MASSPNSSQPQSTQQQWLVTLAQNRQQVACGLLAAGVVFALAWGVINFVYLRENPWVGVEITLPALLCGAAGLVQLLYHPEERYRVDATRLVLLIVGAGIGLDLVLVSLTLGIQWWEQVAGGLKAWQSPEGRRFWFVLMLQISGLAIMFLSLQLARGEERSHAFLRRLVYGYNAVLTGLLLVLILLVLNVLAYIFLPANDPWTLKSIYKLSSRSENILQGLDQPTKIYVLLAGEEQVTLRNVRALIENCRAVNDNIQVEYLSPDRDREKALQLAQKYKFGEREGILVVYGREPNTEHQFISKTALYSGSDMFAAQRENRFFKGESELLTALSYLSGGKQKPIVYFTQGNGELDITDARSREIDKGAGILKQRLERDNITVKGLELSSIEGRTSKNPDVVISTTVPKDATVVVIAGPRQLLPEYAVKALRDYMKASGSATGQGKGKMIVMLDVVVDPEGRMVRTGLEEFLSEFNVKVGDNRVLQISARISDSPQFVRALASPEPAVQARNPVAAAFQFPPFMFVLYNVRTVEPEMGKGPDSFHYQADEFLLVPRQDELLAETDLRTDLGQLLANLFKPEHRKELAAKLSQSNLPVAVTVTEQAPRADPHEQPAATPRLVVFGDATLASNGWMAQRNLGPSYDLFYSLISWLRERPSDIGIEAKEQDIYVIDPAGINYWRLIMLPAIVMFVGIIGLGAVVWVVRRR